MNFAEKKAIVVLGAGFGGLHTAIFLGRRLRSLHLVDRYKVILIDRNRYHTYTPTLYEIATASKETANYCDLKSIVTFPIEASTAGLPIAFLHGEVTKIDIEGGDIHWTGGAGAPSGGRVCFEYLILALGAETNYYGIPGAREHSLPFKSFLDAIRIRDALTAFEEPPRIIIAGGGSTGVELASELREWHREFLVTIVEAMPEILPGFDERVRRRILSRLRRLGVATACGERIVRVEDEIVLQSDETIPYDLLIWAGGTRMPNILETMALRKEDRGRIEVAHDMLCLPQRADLKLAGSIYAIGDIACVYDDDGRPLPGVARAAIDQGTIVAKNVIAEILETEGVARNIRRAAYAPQSYPYIIPVGGKHAIAKVGPLILSGRAGWILKGLVELRYLSSIMPLRHAFMLWLKGLWIFIQNDKMG